jgi:hypothetical protein
VITEEGGDCDREEALLPRLVLMLVLVLVLVLVLLLWLT